MTPAPPTNGSRLEIAKQPMNDHTPNLTGNKNTMFNSSGKPPSSGVMSAGKPSFGSKLFAKPKLNMGKKFQMDVVRDEKATAALDKIAIKKQNNALLKPANVSKPSFTSSSPMGVRKHDIRSSANSGSGNNNFLGGNLYNQDKGLNRDASSTSVGSV